MSGKREVKKLGWGIFFITGKRIIKEGVGGNNKTLRFLTFSMDAGMELFFIAL